MVNWDYLYELDRDYRLFKKSEMDKEDKELKSLFKEIEKDKNLDRGQKEALKQSFLDAICNK